MSMLEDHRRATRLRPEIPGSHGNESRILACDAVLARRGSRYEKISRFILKAKVIAVLIVWPSAAGILCGLFYAPSTRHGVSVKGSDIVAGHGVIVAARTTGCGARRIAGTDQNATRPITHHRIVGDGGVRCGVPQMDAEPAIVRRDVLVDVSARIGLIDTLNVIVSRLAAIRLGGANVVDIILQDVVSLGGVVIIVDS